MKRIESSIKDSVQKGVKTLWGKDLSESMIQVQKTRKDFEGDFTVVVFPLLKISGLSPEETGSVLGSFLKESDELLESFNVIKGFLNIVVSKKYWLALLVSDFQDVNYGMSDPDGEEPGIMIEFSSPNTNKPLHLGHIRNNLLGESISRILRKSGNRVKKVNLVNDRGIHICKSMIAWQEFGNGETPESGGLKGDHLVGKYYVKFDNEYKRQVAELISSGVSKDEAEEQAPILLNAREMLRKWEAGDYEVRKLWEKMNNWVYSGFDVTYDRLGVDFDTTYYESETYKLGKELVLDGLNRGVLIRKDDGSIWADLAEEGLDQKLLLRSDGTSVYMTQDVGTAHQRYSEYTFKQHIYVVGNEQNYHFQVLKLLLKKLSFDWSDRLFHLSYGMVELPEGKMKSREGTVVDADDLMDEMVNTAKEMSLELGKLEDYSEEQRNIIYRQIGMGALKYFILKVDPRKNMVFDPKESIDFNGNTGPFIQYTYARIKSVQRKGEEVSEDLSMDADLNEKEVILLRMIYDYPGVIKESSETLSPSLIANYLYEIAREFNQFYHDHSILNADNDQTVAIRFKLASAIGNIIHSGMTLLGIEVPERM